MNSSKGVIRTFLGRVYRGFNSLLNDAKQTLIRTSTLLIDRKHKTAAVAAVCSTIRVARVASTFSAITGIDLLLCTLAILYDVTGIYTLTYTLDEVLKRVKANPNHNNIAV